MARKYLLVATVFAVVVVADQVTKYLAVAHLTNVLEARGAGTLGERVSAFFGERNLDNDPYVSGRVDHRKPAHVVVPRYWNHKYVENPGAAWGLLSGLDERFRVPFFHLVSLIAITFIALFIRRLEPDQRILTLALALVLGGAVGNYIDRVARNYVIDFVDWHWRDTPTLHWPTFNVADAAISSGVVLMLADSLRPRRRRDESAEAATPGEAAAGGSAPPDASGRVAEASETGVAGEAAGAETPSAAVAAEADATQRTAGNGPSH